MSDDKLMNAFATGKDLTVADLVEKTELAGSTIRTNVKKLLEAKRVKQVDGSKPAAYSITTPDLETPVPSSGGTGRARRAEAAARDERVLTMVGAASPDGRTTKDMSEDLGLKTSLVYISLYRLNRDGAVTSKRVGDRSPRWVKA